MNNTGIFALAAAIFGGAMALVVIWQDRRTAAHWAFAFGMLALAMESSFVCFSLSAVKPEDVIYWETLKLVAGSFLPFFWLAFSIAYARGSARQTLYRWRFRLAALLILPAGTAFLFINNLLAPQLIGAHSQFALILTVPGVALNLMFLLSMVLILMNLERTFRAAVGTMRWRIKFMIIGLGVLFLVRAYTSSQVLLYHRVDPALDILDSGAMLVGCVLIIRTLMRAGHFEVKVYPASQFLHNSIILLLAGIYLLIVGVFANFVRWLGSDSSFTLKAFVLLVGLVVIAVMIVSDRVRLHTKRFISRYFQKPMYDYRLVWRRFTECTASRMDQGSLCRDSVKLVAEVFQALSVTIWLVDEKKSDLTFAASTALSEAQGAELAPGSGAVLAMLAAMQINSEPINIDLSREAWAIALRSSQPDEFHKGGGRICVPMNVGGEVLGIMTLGDRVGGLEFLEQDMDLLKCVGDQVAASLRYLQLSGKLLQVKEMEAFQTMSTFFVHDLKNTASTLGLMLKNLPIHFNDPAFREDALRGVAKTVNHINSLISRLSLLRQGLAIQARETDLNEVVEKAIASHQGVIKPAMIKEYGALPKILLDPEQFLKVMTNLLLNASEAMTQPGEIRIQTGVANNWALLTVADNGCGMSREFLTRSLFRPFQTTKKTGLGIGMFQSKMIIEAHGGRVEVESAPGQGTTFKILLPLNLSK